MVTFLRLLLVVDNHDPCPNNHTSHTITDKVSKWPTITSAK